jgi:hypothetical protein
MKSKSLGISSVFIIMFSALMLVMGAGHATFQNWQSDAFKEKTPRESVQEHHTRDRVQDRDDVYIDRAEDEAAYYEAIAPKGMERDHNYLLKDHPLQEAPLPDKQVE